MSRARTGLISRMGPMGPMRAADSVQHCVLRRISRLDLGSFECHFGLSASALLELSGTDDLDPGHIGDGNRLLRLHRNGDRTSVGRTAND